ncbi:hypothetical protein [Gryllotalpicola koreensis]|uniref:Uncharacterized protein n=1 Tax=Gryllotalpicola koreensis TaxID=993086 RepID=A0ABP8A221_9MICO
MIGPVWFQVAAFAILALIVGSALFDLLIYGPRHENESFVPALFKKAGTCVFKYRERSLLGKIHQRELDDIDYLASRERDKLAALRGHRGAVEAHRTGTSGGSVNGPGNSARTGTGASVNQYNPFSYQMSYTYANPYRSGGLVPASSTSGEFAGLDLAPGVVHGARSFKVDRLGRLTGVTYPETWTPGENLAKCMRQEDAYSTGFYFKGQPATVIHYRAGTDEYEIQLANGSVEFISARIASQIMANPQLMLPLADRDKTHKMDTCAHGFYAYYEGSNDYYKEGFVSAVIEGYGETVVGTRGFRCMKAKILAITLDKNVPLGTAAKVRRNYPDIPVFTTFKEMLSEYPTDLGDAEITPENTEDFWTRKA